MGVDVGDVEVAAATARAVAVELEVGSLTTAECERGLRAAAAMESSAGAMKAMFAARLSATDAHASTSAASPEAHVAVITGVSPAAARAQIELGGQLTGAVGSALKAGEVSTPQAQAIASAARANPNAEAALLAAAPNLTLGQLPRTVRQGHRGRRPRPRRDSRPLTRGPVRSQVRHRRRVPSPARPVHG